MKESFHTCSLATSGYQCSVDGDFEIFYLLYQPKPNLSEDEVAILVSGEVAAMKKPIVLSFQGEIFRALHTHNHAPLSSFNLNPHPRILRIRLTPFNTVALISSYLHHPALRPSDIYIDPPTQPQRSSFSLRNRQSMTELSTSSSLSCRPSSPAYLKPHSINSLSL